MSANILVVDDEAAVRDMLGEWLRGEGYQCDMAGAADEALDLVERRPPLDVALLDLAMPGEDGVWLAKRLRERQQDVAVIMCTGWQSFDAAVEGMRIGVNDYLLKPFSRVELLEAVQRALRWRTETRRAAVDAGGAPQDLDARVDALAGSLRDLGALSGDRLEAWLEGAAATMPEAAAHALRVARMAATLAAQMGRPPQEADVLWRAALLHDVGKLALPEELLQKPGAYTEAEIAAIRRHPELAHAVLVDVPELAAIASIVRGSHEAWDGSGYPDGLAGDAIPLGARIIAVADTYDALTWSPAFREPTTVSRAAAELVRAAGTQFDPLVVRAWLAVLDGSAPARIH
ncbi:MAG: HD domain-containing phosphohydrolase [Vicinamibacterales bacterium]